MRGDSELDPQAIIDRTIHANGGSAVVGIAALEPALTPAEILEMKEEALSLEYLSREEAQAIRLETLIRYHDHLFSTGPDPGMVVRNVFSTAKALNHPALRDFTLEEIGLLTGHGRASACWRTDRIYNAKLKESGARATSASFQKAPGSSEVFAAAAKGNKNRRRSAHRPRALQQPS